MATRNAFGQTWWGEQWLKALAQIDFSNRLPRGRSYANNGSVKQMVLEGSKITARVQGSRPQPYQISITVPALPETDAKVLLDAVARDPLTISKLLNRELDPALLELANELHIRVFPRTWKDLVMRCSCPDSAVPCKHLAAVIYLVSREIDGNPFLVFSLRGLDLIAALKGRNIEVAREAQAALPSLSQLLKAHCLPTTTTTTTTTPAPATTSTPEPDAAKPLAAVLDYTTLPDLADVLPAVLPANPAFFPQADFRALYDKTLRRIGKLARQELAAAATAAAPTPFGPDDKPHLLLGADGTVTPFGLHANQPLLASLGQLDEALLPDLQPQVAGLYHARMLCLHLLARGAVVPQMLDPGQGSSGLRWLPAQQDAAVGRLLQQLASILPDGLVRLQTTSGAVGKSGRAGKASGADGTGPSVASGQPAGSTPVCHLAPAAQAETLCSILLDTMVQGWSDIATEKSPKEKVLNLFFGSRRSRFDGPGEASLAQAIQAWLARFHLSSMAHAPVLCLNDWPDKNDFSLSVAVQQQPQHAGAGAGGGSLNQALIPLAQVLSDTAWQTLRYPVLQSLTLLAQFFPALNQYVKQGATRALTLTPEALPGFLFDTLPVLRLLGIQILLPKALDKLFRPRLSLQMRAKKSSNEPGFLSESDLFEFDWQIALGSGQLSPAEFEQLLGKAHGIVLFKGEYIFLEGKEIEALRKQLAKPPTLQADELLRIALAEEYGGSPIKLDDSARAIIQRLTTETAVPVPTGLAASLRPYQQRGYQWLYRNLCAGFGSVIADDMGLGKTVQVIAMLLKLKQDGALEQGRALVVLPTSLLTNWSRELARFAPQLSFEVFHGSARSLDAPAGAGAEPVRAKKSGKKTDQKIVPTSGQRPDVLLTTYGTLRSDLAKLKKLAWRVLIIDEAQNIKNPDTAQTRAVKAVPAQSFIAMSGTPVENRLSEYWSIMDFANRGLFGTLTRFGKEFGIPIQKEHDQQALQRFSRISAPFLLRRLKSDKSIITDLPDKIEQDQFCSLTPEQSALYESVLQEAMRVIARESDTFSRQGLVLQMITALKQICNHPAHYLKQQGSSAALSGKTALFLDLLDTIVANHEKVLVFTQYREMGELLANWIGQRFGRTPPFLHGGVARARRDEMVERFQNDRTERIFLLSLKAGGTGLNLTAASNVIHYDLWWNPAVEAQATDRAYRIGQQKNVQVHRMITRATFEERINDMIQSKRDLANLTVGQGENWIGNLSNAELAEVFRLG